MLSKLISSYKYGIELQELYAKDGYIYNPVRLVILDYTLSDNIPLEDYDNNEGEPFWMRAEYILKHYSRMPKKTG